MAEQVTFNYFYGEEADVYTFYKIPKQLFTSNYFKDISTDAKVLYGLMLDRMALSIKNEWFDDENRAYIYFSIEETMELLNCGHNKAVKSMQELDTEGGIGLIEKKRRGMGKTNMIYVKNFTVADENEEAQKFTKGNSEEKKVLKKFIKGNSCIPKNGNQEVYISNANNTDINNTYLNNNKSNLILSADVIRLDETKRYSETLRDTLDIDLLVDRYPYDRDKIEGIYNLILEIMLAKGKTIVVSKNEYTMDFVKSRLSELNSRHIEYVLERINTNTNRIRNIKQYMLTSLFNAVTTIDCFYQNVVNSDNPQYAKAE